MPAGRPSKPLELKQLAGNPGHRPLPVPGTTLPPVLIVPPFPRGLRREGKFAWTFIWDKCSRWVGVTDEHLVFLFCHAIDRWWAYERLLRKEGLSLTGSTGQRVAHWAIREQRLLDGELIRMSGLLGLTPSDRARLGIAAVKAATKLDEFLSRRRGA